jgi:hypothetical protein
MSLKLTYTNHIVWKTNKQTINTIIPSNSFPQNSSGPDFKARPIKHWRKQLTPTVAAGFSSSVIHYFDTPGNSINRSNEVDCNFCDENKKSKFLNIYIPHAAAESQPQLQTPISSDYDIINNRCMACNPEAHVIKSASTILNKNYYTDSKAYLQNRCKTYNQNLPSAKYNPDTNDPNTNGVSFPMLNCYNENCQNQKTIYKPSNSQFSLQGAASSSTRIAKLKYDTITQNGNSFHSAIGLAAANAGRYMGTSEPPFFIKSKFAKSVCNTRSGNHTKCFKTLINTNTPRLMNPTKDCLCVS